MKKATLAFLLSYMTLIFSCNDEAIKQKDDMSSPALTPEVIKKIEQMGYKTEGIESVLNKTPDNKMLKGFMVEHDVFLSYDEIIALDQASVSTDKTNGRTEHWRGTNLVTPKTRTLIVWGITGGDPSPYFPFLSPTMKDGLASAIADYNALGLSIKFTLKTGPTAPPEYNIVIYKDILTSALGSRYALSGQPTALGQPHGYIVIADKMRHQSVAANTWLMKHVLGHSIGLVHTDWNLSTSCGRGSIKADNADAENVKYYINGTPDGYDYGSMMNTCPLKNKIGQIEETGLFSESDKTALRNIYPTK